MKKKPLVVIAGTTASGKTDISLELAKLKNGEIVSADSMQIYKKLDIGTAKPTKEQLKAVKHYMIDIVEPSQKFSVADYCQIAHEKIKVIYEEDKLPIAVGGTGLYINSLVNNISFVDAKTDPKLRAELFKRAENEGIDRLIDEVGQKDKAYAQKLRNEPNLKRVVRALEIIKTTDKTVSECIEASQKGEKLYNPVFIGLTFKNRQALYENINKRVDKMLKQGLLNEAKYVMSLSDTATAKSAIGYKEFFPYLNKTATLDECIEKLKQASRNYAKRQLTWFRKNEEMNWVYIDDFVNEKNEIDYDGIVKAVLNLAKDVI